MRGRIVLQIDQRINTMTFRYADKWNKIDKVALINLVANNQRYFKFISIKLGCQSFIITRDELAFVRLIYHHYGKGDYCIRTWGKGHRGTGFRTFWDGIITSDKRFIRRKDTGAYKMVSSMFGRDTMGKNPEQHIGKYMKTKRAGNWHNFLNGRRAKSRTKSSTRTSS